MKETFTEFRNKLIIVNQKDGGFSKGQLIEELENYIKLKTLKNVRLISKDVIASIQCSNGELDHGH